MPEVRTYASDQVMVIVSGIPATGLAADTFVNIEPQSDMVAAAAGADGEVARSRNADRRARVTITLLGTSPTNTAFSALVAADELSGSFMFPITVQDLRGDTMFAAPQCWVVRKPNISLGGTVANKEWVFETGAPSVWNIGGNFT